MVDLIADYLRESKTFALNDLQAGFPGTPPERSIRWCLTVPAIWTDTDKQAMHQAAQKAGPISDDLADEDRLIWSSSPRRRPRTASSRTRGCRRRTRPGTRFMIVDAGGGTVDVTVHELGSGGWSEEAVPADGGRFGSMNLDRAFQQHLLDLLGPDAIRHFHSPSAVSVAESDGPWSGQLRMTTPSPGTVPSISPGTSSCWQASGGVPATARRRGDVSCLPLSRAATDAIFQKVVGRIVGVVYAPVRRTARDPPRRPVPCRRLRGFAHAPTADPGGGLRLREEGSRSRRSRPCRFCAERSLRPGPGPSSRLPQSASPPAPGFSPVPARRR